MDYYSSQYADSSNYRRESASSNYSHSSTPSLNQQPRMPQDTLNPRVLGRNYAPSPRDSPPLTPPHLPFSNSNRSPSMVSSSPSNTSTGKEGVSTSLSVNYLPTKFSRPHSPGVHARRGKNGGLKTGGGREAFSMHESRMPGANDEDYDGVQTAGGWFGGKGHKPALRWNRFKWILFISNFLVTTYSLASLIACLLTWFNIWDEADVVRVGNRPELILSTAASALGVLTSLIGWSGILLNNRAFLAIYTVLMWVTLAFLCAPGYITYKHRTFNLEGKVNAQWSRDLGTEGRLRIQNQLQCCGYFSPFVEATISQTCYARSLLPGCKGDYLRFEMTTLKNWYIISFGLAPLQIFGIVCALLCSNHVTYRFGKGMMPKKYRLSMSSMAVIMDNYASQLADQYGEDVASDILTRSRSNLNLDRSGTATPVGNNGGGAGYAYSDPRAAGGRSGNSPTTGPAGAGAPAYGVVGYEDLRRG